MKIGRYMTANPVGTSPHETWIITDSHNGELGIVERYQPWRRFVFIPERNAVFSHDCLAELAQFIDARNK